MHRIYAGRVAAEMVDSKSFWNRTNEKLIDGAMRFELAALARESSGGLPITISITSTNPQPTWAEFRPVQGKRAVLVDKLPDSLF